jgi:hypothetical protein
MGPRIAPEAKPYTYKYVAPKKEFSLELRFRRSQVAAADIAEALRSVADGLDGDNNGRPD